MEESFWKQTYEKILIGMALFGITNLKGGS